jgi:hypothetical protein
LGFLTLTKPIPFPWVRGMYPWVRVCTHGSRVCIREEIFTHITCVYSKEIVFLPKTTFLACIKLNNKSILQGFRVIVICIHNLIYEKKHTEGHFTLN